jgi:hypothetical protein
VSAPDDGTASLATSDLEASSQTRTVAPTPAPPAARSSAGSSTTVGSPLEALERDEMLRTRRFCIVGIAIALAGGAAVALLPGDPTATLLVFSAIGLAIASITFLLSRTGDPLQFRRPSSVFGWFFPAICITSALPFFGVFSPAPIVLVLGIYFTGLGKNTVLAFSVYSICAGVQLVLAVLIISGALRDPGLITVELATRDQIIVQALVQFVLAATFVTARMSRRTALVAVGELERAVRVARRSCSRPARSSSARCARAAVGSPARRCPATSSAP